MRLNAYLARAGVASRRGADQLIKAGRVQVNGAPGQLNTFVARGDRVELDGEEVRAQRLAYILLYKPAGTVTTALDPQGRPTVVELVDLPERVVPVGRLDADTTGALLLTNDGPLAHRLAHPRYGVEKVYEVEVEGEPDAEAVRRLAEGVEGGGVQRAADLCCQRVSLGRQGLDLAFDRVVRRLVGRLDRGGRRRQGVPRELPERCVHLLVDVAEPPDGLAVRDQRLRRRLG